MRAKGKDPSQNVGMSETSVRNAIKRLDRIHRRIWDIEDAIILQLTHDVSDTYNRLLDKDEICKQNGEPYSVASKRKKNDALVKYHQWNHYERDGALWSPKYQFSEISNRQADEFTKAERRKLRNVSLDWKTIPAYSDLSPEQRDRWAQYIAMRLGKLKKDVNPDDWQLINCSWLIPSLTWISLDAGLRPIEIERSLTDWLRLDKEALYIPKNQSAKGREHWECALLPQTVAIAQKWLEERKCYEKYQGKNSLWLTREGNPYSSSSLNPLIRQMCKEAGINLENRRIKWYSIRHSVGNYMTSEGGLQQAKGQLRHESISSTLRYQEPTIEDRQDTLNNMG
jgi:integrase